MNVVKFLAQEAKANVGSQDYRDRNCLHLACGAGHLDVVQFLVQEMKMNVEAKGNYNWTCIHCACEGGHLNVVRYLVEGAKVNAEAKTKDNWTCLHIACHHSDRVDVVQYLVQNTKVDVNAKEDIGWTGLHRACLCGHFEIVKFLVEVAKADPECKSRRGETCADLAKRPDIQAYLRGAFVCILSNSYSF